MDTRGARAAEPRARCFFLTLSLSLLLGKVAADTMPLAQQQIEQCFATRNCSARTFWGDLRSGKPPCVTSHRVWWSSAPSPLEVTLVTQLSLSRLGALEQQCKLWAGPLAAAIYMPLYSQVKLDRGEGLSSKNQRRLDKATARVEALFRTLEAAQPDTEMKKSSRSLLGSSNTQQQAVGPCQLRIMLLYEVFAEREAMVLYPVNLLRNYARLMAETTLIANIDVDMIPSETLSTALMFQKTGIPVESATVEADGAVRLRGRQLSGWSGWKSKMYKPKGDTGGNRDEGESDSSALELPEDRVDWDSSMDPRSSSLTPGSIASLLAHIKANRSTLVVIPAFECVEEDPPHPEGVPRYSKAQLVAAVKEKVLAPFNYRVQVYYHYPTNFELWYKMGLRKEVPEMEYKVNYKSSFEPWYISERGATQWFDVRYKGYGKNKIQQVAHAAHHGAPILVHPSGFLYHLPHAYTPAQKQFVRDKMASRLGQPTAKNTIFKLMDKMWIKDHARMKERKFQATVDSVLAECIRVLPWWQGEMSEAFLTAKVYRKA